MIVAGAVVAVGLLPSQASASPAVPALKAGIPALVQPNADLASQVPGPEGAWVDSIFIAGRVHGGGHDFAIIVHTLAFPNADQGKLYVSVLDTTTGWYRNWIAPPVSITGPGDRLRWSDERLNISMPGLTWTGDAKKMRVKTETPWGSLKARFVPEGPVFNYAGVGVVDLLGDVNYEYAFPTMRTKGSLTLKGRTRQVSGSSWLDRQWGPVPVEVPSMRWTWMNISLDSGNELAIWDIVDDEQANSWVTMQRPRGAYKVARVRPLARGAGRYWTSPETGKTYPTRWRLRIPGLGCRLRVLDSAPRGQEFSNGHVEAAADVTGKCRGRRVSGDTFVEMTGDWQTPSL